MKPTKKNPVLASPEELIRQKHIVGVDVSHWQGTIDWRQVAAQGIDFAWLKATEGATYTDSQLQRNVKELADNTVMRFGFYHFAYPPKQKPDLEGLERDGRDEAAHFIKTLKEVLYNANMVDDFDHPRFLPLILDYEHQRFETYTASEHQAWIGGFIDEVRFYTDAKLMIYTATWLGNQLVNARIPRRHPDVGLWLARWPGRAHDGKANLKAVLDDQYPEGPKGWPIDFWQYTECGKVPGIGRCDINVWVRTGTYAYENSLSSSPKPDFASTQSFEIHGMRMPDSIIKEITALSLTEPEAVDAWSERVQVLQSLPPTDFKKLLDVEGEYGEPFGDPWYVLSYDMPMDDYRQHIYGAISEWESPQVRKEKAREYEAVEQAYRIPPPAPPDMFGGPPSKPKLPPQAPPDMIVHTTEAGDHTEIEHVELTSSGYMTVTDEVVDVGDASDDPVLPADDMTPTNVIPFKKPTQQEDEEEQALEHALDDALAIEDRLAILDTKINRVEQALVQLIQLLTTPPPGNTA